MCRVFSGVCNGRRGSGCVSHLCEGKDLLFVSVIPLFKEGVRLSEEESLLVRLAMASVARDVDAFRTVEVRMFDST